MNDALVKALDPKLARLNLKKVAKDKSTALEPQHPFARLVKKNTSRRHQENTHR